MVGTRTPRQLATKRRLFHKLMAGVLAMWQHRRGHLKLPTSESTVARPAKKATRERSRRRGGVVDRGR